ncbi:MAG: hypothetical protein E4H20_04980 [Spirochaetales bacterium]|nr:MAG: hypothetical protein E4H20_04980 [Spirochaetales bacterium]
MDTWFKGFILGLGVLLGLAPAREAPGLDARLHRDALGVYATVEILDTPSRELRELVRSTYPVRLSLFARAGPLSVTAWREIRYTGTGYEVLVSDTGGRHGTADEAAAWAIATRFLSLHLGPTSGLAFPLEFGCRVTLELPGEDEYDPMVLWGYKPAASFREVGSLGSIPYY